MPRRIWHRGIGAASTPLKLSTRFWAKFLCCERWAAPGVNQQSGSGYTVKAVTRHHGPSERFTANLADLDQSTLNTVTGQGGNFLSPYYMDQWNAWYRRLDVPIAFHAASRGELRRPPLGSATCQIKPAAGDQKKSTAFTSVITPVMTMVPVVM